MTSKPSVSELLREWRRRRGLSQLDLACETGISARHLSFLETGRSQPSREMLLRLAERLQIPLRHRNALLNAGGYASVFPERQLRDPALQVIRAAVDVVLAGHRPYPAMAVDRHWTLVASNGGFEPFLSGVDPALLRPPVNVLRLTLHPRGLGRRIANYQQWRAHVLDRLQRQIAMDGDPFVIDLLRELRECSRRDGLSTVRNSSDTEQQGIVVPFQVVTEAGILSFFTTTTVFGTPVDVTVSELSLECFYPADAHTAAALNKA